MIEPGRIRLQVPLAEDGSRVACLLQQFGKGLLRPVKRVKVAHLAVHVAVFTGQNRSSAWSADGVGAEIVLKKGPFPRQPVNIGCRRYFGEWTAVGRDRFERVIIRKEEEDIRPA